MKSPFRCGRYAVLFALLLALLCPSRAVRADLLADHIANIAAGSVNKAALAGELSLLLSGGKDGKHEAIQGAKALGATALTVQALKYLVREKRPNSESLSSFPSGHTAEAFAMATVLADYRPGSALFAYGGAALVGWARVHQGEHHWQDVVAGALIGHFIAKQFTKSNFGVNPDGTLGYHTEF